VCICSALNVTNRKSNAADMKAATECQPQPVRPTDIFTQTYCPKMRLNDIQSTSNNRSQLGLPTVPLIIRTAYQSIVTYIPHFITVTILRGQNVSLSTSLCDILNFFSLILSLVCRNIFMKCMSSNTYNLRSSRIVWDRHLQPQKQEII
jgi:hypothetical protein